MLFDTPERQPQERTKRALDQQPDHAVLVGYSHGGAVITEAGNHPKVAALVYISAVAPDRGEPVDTLIADPVAAIIEAAVNGVS